MVSALNIQIAREEPEFANGLIYLRNDKTYSDIVKAFLFEVLILNQFSTQCGLLSPS
jgi:hypothetical protein